MTTRCNTILESCALNLDIGDFIQSWNLLNIMITDRQNQHQQQYQVNTHQIVDTISSHNYPSTKTATANTTNACYTTLNNDTMILESVNNTFTKINSIEEIKTPTYLQFPKNRKILKSPVIVDAKLQFSSSLTCSTNLSSIKSGNNILQSNPQHLKRRRRYRKRKNSSLNSNPAQTQMEFHFPVWTFHLEY